MARPILRLVTRLTRRTRATAWAIAFGCMVLVGALSLADGFANGIDSVANRIGSGPALYIRGTELLTSEIDSTDLANLSGAFLTLRAHPALLEMNGLALETFVVVIESYRNGTVTTLYPVGSRDVSLDTGLRARVLALSGSAPDTTANLTVFGRRLPSLPIVAPIPSRPALLADDWTFVRPELLYSIDPNQGGPVQAIVVERPLDAGLANRMGLTRLETLGAIGFVRGSVAEVQAALQVLSLVIAIVIGLLVYAAMSLEVHQRSGEIATLRSLGASPTTVASVYEAQAIVLALVGAVLGSALGIVLAHAVVSFAPLLGFPNLVILGPPTNAVLLAVTVATIPAAIAGIVPSRRAAVRVRTHREAVPS